MSIKVTIRDSSPTPMKVLTNGRPLAKDLRGELYEACVNAYVACNGIDLDAVASITIEVFTPLHVPATIKPMLIKHDKDNPTHEDY